MPKLSEKNKLIALAHLHQGKTPREVERSMADVSYPQALNLKNQLAEAKELDTLGDLFDLEEAAIETLLESVQGELEAAAKELTGEFMPLMDTIDDISSSITSTKLLEQEMAKAGTTMVKKIAYLASNTNSPDSLCALAEALSKLQTAFFKNSAIQIANFQDGGAKFEEFITK